MKYNGGTKSMKAGMGQTIETPYGSDRSDLVGPASEECRACEGGFGGSRSSLSHSLSGANAKQE